MGGLAGGVVGGWFVVPVVPGVPARVVSMRVTSPVLVPPVQPLLLDGSQLLGLGLPDAPLLWQAAIKNEEIMIADTRRM